MNKSMILLTRTTSMILLFVVGITALLGGAALIIDPTGLSMGLSVSGLNETFFQNYLGPGVILFLVIGVLSFSAAILTLGNHRYYPMLIFYQGLMLTGWILVQIYLLPTTHFLQAVYFLFGLVLLMCGSYLLLKKEHLKILY